MLRESITFEIEAPRKDGERRANAWRPVIDGVSTEDVNRAAKRILDALRARFNTRPENIHDIAGYAILHQYLETDSNLSSAVLQAVLDEMTLRASLGRVSHGLFGGVLGFGWAISHLQRNGYADALSVNLADVDDLAWGVLQQAKRGTQYDLISGIVGVGVYALERAELGIASAILQGAVTALELCSERDAGQATWFCFPELLPESKRKHNPEGFFDLGMAHGVAGPIALLARASRHAPDQRSLDLLRDAVGWLLDKAQPFSAGIGFPALIDRAQNHSGPARLGWCYGDLSVACALLGAASALKDEGLREFALTLARHCAQRRRPDGGVSDTPLCHGSQGIAHVMARFFNLTGEVLFRDASVYWLRDTLAHLRHDVGIGGVQYALYPGTDRELWVDVDSLLDGAAGVALSLSAMVNDSVPEWDRILLTDLDYDF